MYIVSITVTSFRIHKLPQVLESLEIQELLPEKVYVYYSTEPFHLDKGITELPKLTTKLDVEFVCVPNLGSCRKYLFTTRKYIGQDKLLAFVDDDILWDKSVFSTLVAAMREQKLGMVTTCGWAEFSLMKNEKNETIIGTKMKRSTEIKKKVEILVASSGWATTINAKFLDERIFDTALQQEYRINETDEIFFSCMMKCKKYVIPLKKCSTDIETSVELWRNAKSSDAKLKQMQLLSQIRKLKWKFVNGYYTAWHGELG